MWKCLHDDPGTSKLLKQIYGGSRPEISYPKQVKAVPRANLPPALSHEKSIGKDTRTDGKGTRKLRVPKFRGTKPEEPALIDSAVMRRRRAVQIQEEQAVNRDRLEHYRPPFIKPVGQEEKSRLAEKFEFGGGKALPEEMTGPIMPIPSEVRWKASEARRIAETMRRRKGLPDNFVEGGGGEGSGKYSSQATTMFDQVANEIEERQQFLLEARETGLPCEHESRIIAEISQRMSELTRLTPSG